MLTRENERLGFALAALLHRDSDATAALSGLTAEARGALGPWFAEQKLKGDAHARIQVAATALRGSVDPTGIQDPRVSRWFGGGGPPIRRGFTPDEGVRQALRLICGEHS